MLDFNKGSFNGALRKVHKRFHFPFEVVIWSHSAAVTARHPIGAREVGWDAVKASFEEIAQLASDWKIELKDQLIRIAGDVVY